MSAPETAAAAAATAEAPAPAPVPAGPSAPVINSLGQTERTIQVISTPEWDSVFMNFDFDLHADQWNGRGYPISEGIR
jgi:hypothetical protein